MPIDINDLRSYKGGNPEIYKHAMKQRFKSPQLVDDVLSSDETWRNTQNTLDAYRQTVNALQKIIAPKKKKKEDCTADIVRMKDIQVEIRKCKEVLPKLAEDRNVALRKIGNIVDGEVSISQDEADNLVISLYPNEYVGNSLPCSIKDLKYAYPHTAPLTHDELLYRIDGYEPVRGQNVAGHRGYFLKNAGVLLNQAFLNYGISFLRKKGYDILQPPYMMNKDVMANLAQLDDFDEQLYTVKTGNEDKYLIATSEQPIVAYHQQEWLDEKSLPLKYAGVSTCFRKEAGSSGKDIRGIFRVHQFEKIEQVVFALDSLESSQKEHKKMLSIAEEFYQSLDFPYRVVCLVSGELNDAAIKKYDLEAWYPAQQAYRELVSCSNCTDYQSRGVNTRCGMKQKASENYDPMTERTRHVHILNSTLCATGRAICCLLENYQTVDGVKIPKVLQPFMGGEEFLPFVRDAPELTKGEKGKGKNKKVKEESQA